MLTIPVYLIMWYFFGCFIWSIIATYSIWKLTKDTDEFKKQVKANGEEFKIFYFITVWIASFFGAPIQIIVSLKGRYRKRT